MNPTIIAAIISGSVALVGPILTYVITRLVDQLQFERIDNPRSALLGKWVGKILQDFQGKPIELRVNVTFTAGRRVVEGLAHLDNPIPGQPALTLKFTGGFRHGRLLKLDYKPADENIMQFGCYIARLAADGRRLEGHFVGYGAIQDRILCGSAVLEKQT